MRLLNIYIHKEFGRGFSVRVKGRSWLSDLIPMYIDIIHDYSYTTLSLDIAVSTIAQTKKNYIAEFCKILDIIVKDHKDYIYNNERAISDRDI